MDTHPARLDFRNDLNALQAPPPWSVDPAEPGRIIDANGEVALVVAGKLSDREALHLCALVILAVNTCADFVATRPTEEPGA